MVRFIFHLSVALLTFVVGFGANALVNQLGDRFISSTVFHLPSTARCRRPGPASLWFNYGSPIVVGVNNDRRVYLGKVEVGSLDDTSLLRDRLTKMFQWRKQQISSADSTSDLSTGEKIEQSVFVKAPPSISFTELGGLLNAIRETGADRIEIITDFPKTDYRFIGRRPYGSSTPAPVTFWFKPSEHRRS